MEVFDDLGFDGMWLSSAAPISIAGPRCTCARCGKNTPEKHTDDGETLHNPAAQDSASNNLRGEPASDRPAG